MPSEKNLQHLIAAYKNCIILEESFPNALRVSKIFTSMKWSKGGLVLLGVRSDGEICGVDESNLASCYLRFSAMCRTMTKARIMLGTIDVGRKTVLFMVFNTIHRHLAPLQPYDKEIVDQLFV